MTVHSSPTPVSDNSVLPTLKHSLSVGRAAVLETGPLPTQDHSLEQSAAQFNCVCCRTANLGGYWKNVCSDSEAVAQCELFLTASNRNILTYLLIKIFILAVNVALGLADVEWLGKLLHGVWSVSCVCDVSVVGMLCYH